ncbi:hypothetical protein BJ996_006829 [Streptomyces phaeogriseichromatogenes]|nr:hypothetical protein [Streptomyces murinus]
MPEGTRTALAVSAGIDTHTRQARALASPRILTGFVFLWAFLDKTFGLGYATASGNAWIDGMSPTPPRGRPRRPNIGEPPTRTRPFRNPVGP